MRRAVAAGLALFVPALSGCGSSSSAPAESHCPALTVAVGDGPPAGGLDRCVPQFDDCGDDAIPVLGGGCTVIGVPAGSCAEGFTAGGAGCAPTLPVAACEKGKIAIPGDASCREIMPCGDGTWGTIATDATTVFVDGTAIAGGDGSKGKPYRTIGEAYAAATTGATIAIAAGTYTETLSLDKPVTLSGVCPSKVEIVGSTDGAPAIETTAETTIRGLAITGPSWAIATAGKTVLDRVWIHDTAHFGLQVYDQALTLTDSLVESCAEAGVYVEGTTVTIERTAIRSIRPNTKKTSGAGVHAEPDAMTRVPPHVIVHRSLVDDTYDTGIAVVGGQLEVSGTFVRDTKPRASDGRVGAGIFGSSYSKTGARSTLVVDASVVEKSRRAGIELESSDGTVTNTVVRDGVPIPSIGYGNGIEANAGSTLTVRDSLVQANRYIGVGVFESTATIERTILRDTRAGEDGTWGVGITAWTESPTRSNVTVSSCRIANNQTAGVAVGGSSLTLDASSVVGTLARDDGSFGDGILVTARHADTGTLDADVTVTASTIDGNARAGAVTFGASISLGSSVLRCNAFDLELEEKYGTASTGEPWTSPVVAKPIEPIACGCGTAWASCRAQTVELSPIETPLHAGS